jgi:hypothetical protein
MVQIKYGMDTFLEALEPGLCALVMSKFKNRLKEKMEKAVEEVFKEMKAELPQEIKAKIYSLANPELMETTLNVVVDLTQGNKGV